MEMVHEVHVPSCGVSGDAALQHRTGHWKMDEYTLHIVQITDNKTNFSFY